MATEDGRRDPVEDAEEQWRQRGWEGAEFMAASSTIMRAQQIVLARMNAILRPLRLTQSRFEALLLLYFQPDWELPLVRTSERLQVHLTSITSTIDRLEADGLVERHQRKVDRRTTLAKLTPAGAALTEKAVQAVIEAHHGLGDLTDADARRITKTLVTLRRDATSFGQKVLPAD